MEITSLQYLVFVLSFLGAYQVLNSFWRKILLLSFSLFFYGSYSLQLLGALIFSIVFNYWITFATFSYKNWIAVAINLLLLCSFKIPNNDYLMPIGISFFTFQALSFVFDYGKKSVQIGLLDFANYLCFFPQLIAGPIEKYDKLGSQLNQLNSIKQVNIFPSLLFILKGLVLKLVIADRCGVFVDEFYGNIASFDGWFFILANLLFTVQILLDFSGYTLIARGVAKLLGIELSVNFNQPYQSKSIAEFWRNWHITLHIWFKNYLFTPLKSVSNWWIALSAVFILSGLWHGLKINFILWGLFSLLAFLVDKFFLQKIRVKFLNWTTTFILISAGWVLFRINDFLELSDIFNLSYDLSVLKLFMADLLYVFDNGVVSKFSASLVYKGTFIPFTYFDFWILIGSVFIWAFQKPFKLYVLPSYLSIIVLFIVLCFFGYDSESPFIYLQF